MISERLHLIIDNINAQGEMRYVESTNKTQIAAFEKRNDISLPTQYKEWLCFSDGGELYLPAGIQLYGIEHEPKIDITNNDRPSRNKYQSITTKIVVLRMMKHMKTSSHYCKTCLT